MNTINMNFVRIMALKNNVAGHIATDFTVSEHTLTGSSSGVSPGCKTLLNSAYRNKVFTSMWTWHAATVLIADFRCYFRREGEWKLRDWVHKLNWREKWKRLQRVNVGKRRGNGMLMTEYLSLLPMYKFKCAWILSVDLRHENDF